MLRTAPQVGRVEPRQLTGHWGTARARAWRRADGRAGHKLSTVPDTGGGGRIPPRRAHTRADRARASMSVAVELVASLVPGRGRVVALIAPASRRPALLWGVLMVMLLMVMVMLLLLLLMMVLLWVRDGARLHEGWGEA